MSIEKFSGELPKEAGVAYRNSIAHDIWELRKDKGTDVAIEVLKSLKEESEDFEPMSELVSKETGHHREKGKNDKQESGVNTLFNFVTGLKGGDENFLEKDREVMGGASLLKEASKESSNKEKSKEIEQEKEKINLEKLISQKEMEQRGTTDMIAKIESALDGAESPRDIIKNLASIKSDLPVEIKSELESIESSKGDKEKIVKSLVDRIFHKTPEHLLKKKIDGYLLNQKESVQKIPKEILKMKKKMDSLDKPSSFYEKELINLIDKRCEKLSGFDKIGELGLIKRELECAGFLANNIANSCREILDAQDIKKQLEEINPGYNKKTSQAVGKNKSGTEYALREIGNLRKERMTIKGKWENLTDAQSIKELTERDEEIDKEIESLKEKIKDNKDSLPHLYHELGTQINRSAMFDVIEKDDVTLNTFLDYFDKMSEKMFGCDTKGLHDVLSAREGALSKIKSDIIKDFSNQINQATPESHQFYLRENFLKKGGTALTLQVSDCGFNWHCTKGGRGQNEDFIFKDSGFLINGSYEHKCERNIPFRDIWDQDQHFVSASKLFANEFEDCRETSQKYLRCYDVLSRGTDLIYFPISSSRVDGIKSASDLYCEELLFSKSYVFNGCDRGSVFASFNARIDQPGKKSKK